MKKPIKLNNATINFIGVVSICLIILTVAVCYALLKEPKPADPPPPHICEFKNTDRLAWDHDILAQEKRCKCGATKWQAIEQRDVLVNPT